MANVSVLRWDDVGAPQILQGKPSEILDVLKAALVTGYGAKASLGWSIVFENRAELKIVFKNNTAQGGSGGEIRFRSFNGSDNPRDVVAVMAATQFFDINTAARPIGEFAISASNERRAWVIIGTGTAFYFFIERHKDFSVYGSRMAASVYDNFSMFCGDFESFYVNDPGRFIVVSTPGVNGNMGTGWYDSLNYYLQISTYTDSGGNTIRIYDLDNSNDYAAYTIMTPFFSSPGDMSDYAPAEHNVVGDILIALPMQFRRNSATKLNGQPYLDSNKQPAYRGRLPGLKQTGKPGYGNLFWPQTTQVDGQSHFLFKNAHTYESSVMVNMEQWP